MGDKKVKNKAQIGMEYMTIVVFLTVIIVPLILLYYTQYEGTNEQIRGNQADQIARKVIDAAETVYYLGAPSKTTVKVYIPQQIENITVGNNDNDVGNNDKELVFFMRTRQGIDEVVRMSSVNINGSISGSFGIKYITVESKGDYVQITSY